MSSLPVFRRLSRCGLSLGLLCGLGPSLAWAAPDAAKAVAPPAPAASRTSSQLLDFDIPALPLDQALDRYAALTGRPALFSSETVASRTSSPLRGHYTPEAALRRLLEGTGLVAELAKSGPSDAFVLKPARSASASLQSALKLAGAYPGLVQARLWRALCGNSATRPGGYRILLRFLINRDGSIKQVRLLGSTGDAQRDAAVQATLESVRLEPPPPAMPQPLTMLVLPDDGAQQCAAN